MTIGQIGEWCSVYNTMQDMNLIPRYTDKLSLDNNGYIRDFSGNVIGYYGEFPEVNKNDE